MVEQNSNEALSDDELERELRALLDVEPSPDFVARVRTDVHADAIADVWPTGRWIAVAAAAVVIVSVSVWIATRSVQPLTSPAAIVSQQVPSVPSVQSLAPPAVPSSAAQTAAPAARVPEVVVSPRESAGLRYLLAALRDGRLDSAAMPSDHGDVVDMPIVIEPITVEPLVAAADLETGAGQ
jgi:hypothetical protein